MISKHSWMMIMHYVGEACRFPEEYKEESQLYDGRDDYGNFYYVTADTNMIALYLYIENNKHTYIRTASWTFEEFLKLKYMDFCNKLRELREQTMEGIL